MHSREVTIAVLRDMLVIDGKTPARPDTAVIELAGLMHERLIGALHVQRDAARLDHVLALLSAHVSACDAPGAEIVRKREINLRDESEGPRRAIRAPVDPVGLGTRER